ncbi:MAG: tetratricopeptide repeat protein [Verrucomicrobia bacterium]|nr:tetratricopeptide repeat protein [Verrucomicrobiota bacterium]MCH8526067.1 LysM peptidoglycan-binding domain-containing protein [Kiritimatiellia bacterium]
MMLRRLTIVRAVPGRLLRPGCLGLVLFFAACGPKFGTDALEHRHPRMEEAARLVQQQDLEGAMAIYRRLLRREPEFATAHLQLGMAYQTLRDPVAAAYHFRQYLDQRPEGPKAEIVEQMLQSELIRLVDQHPAIRAMQPPDIVELQDEIARLREQLQHAQMRLSRSEIEAEQARRNGVPERAAPRRDSTPAPEPADTAARERTAPVSAETTRPQQEPATASRTYVVRPGDNLSLISQRMYNTPNRWREIMDANREKLPNERSLRPGQTLVIP